MEKELIIEIQNDDINVELDKTEKVIVFDNDYNKLKNKPQINSVELQENKSFEDLGLVPLTNSELEKIFKF